MRLFVCALVLTLVVPPGCRQGAAPEEPVAADKASSKGRGPATQRTGGPRPNGAIATAPANGDARAGSDPDVAPNPLAAADDDPTGLAPTPDDAPDPNDSDFEVAELEILVDCNRSIWSFGLEYSRRNRYQVKKDSGLDQVIAAVTQAVSSQSEFTVGGGIRYCGYADEVRCADAKERAWIDVCEPFDEKRMYGGMGKALQHLLAEERDQGKVGILIAHGFSTPPKGRPGAMDAGRALQDLPFRELGSALGRRGMTFAVMMLDAVPYKSRKYGDGTKLRTIAGPGKKTTPVAAMAVILWGPDNRPVRRALQAMHERLRGYGPHSVRLAPFDGGEHLPSFTEVTPRVSRSSVRGRAPVEVLSGHCQSPSGRSVSCTSPLPEMLRANHPERELLALSFRAQATDHSGDAWATWRPEPRPRALRAAVDARLPEATRTPESRRLQVDTIPVVPADAGLEGLASGRLRPARLPPTGGCEAALDAVRLSAGEGIAADALGAGRHWNGAALVPVRCLLGADGARNNVAAESAALDILVDFDPPDPDAGRAALDALMDRVGLPDTSKAAGDRILGLRQALHAVAAAALGTGGADSGETISASLGRVDVRFQ